jgi:hypothetical protein
VKNRGYFVHQKFLTIKYNMVWMHIQE